MSTTRPARRGARPAVASDEERLVSAARERDETAWSRIFDENFQALHRYAYYRTGDADASEELAAQVFEEALRGIKNFEYRGSSIRAWLFTIARNLVASHLAARARLRQTELSESMPGSDSPEESEVDEALAALRALSTEQQQVVTLTLMEDLSARDCADVMHLTVRQVHALQLQALRQLRAAVSGQMVVQ